MLRQRISKLFLTSGLVFPVFANPSLSFCAKLNAPLEAQNIADGIINPVRRQLGKVGKRLYRLPTRNETSTPGGWWASRVWQRICVVECGGVCNPAANILCKVMASGKVQTVRTGLPIASSLGYCTEVIKRATGSGSGFDVARQFSSILIDST